MADSVGAGSPWFGQDSRTANGGWERGASGLRRATGYADVAEMLRGAGSGVTKARRNDNNDKGGIVEKSNQKGPASGMYNVEQDRDSRGEEDGIETAGLGVVSRMDDQKDVDHSVSTQPKTTKTMETKKRLFDGLCFYINGSTAPTVSDHRLKQLIAENGGRVAVALARRRVTHVILGTAWDRRSSSPAFDGGARATKLKGTARARGERDGRRPARLEGRTTGGEGGLGGGGGGGAEPRREWKGCTLAAGKLEKEIQRMGGNVVKYVTAEWVLESLRSGKRVSESSFASQTTTIQFTSSDAQRTILGMFKADTSTSSSSSSTALMTLIPTDGSRPNLGSGSGSDAVSASILPPPSLSSSSSMTTTTKMMVARASKVE